MTARIRTKICGITREEDLFAAAAAGADAIGLVFYPPSKRFVALDSAARLRRLAPSFMSVVALFVNPDAGIVEQTINTLGPDLLQFHGDEPESFCRSFGRRYLKACRVGAPGLQTPAEIAAYCRGYASAAGWLFDSFSPGFGGSGSGFDTSLLAEVERAPGAPSLILSGGLNPDNVAQALCAIRPDALDVSSGVELSPGIKSAELIQSFIDKVNSHR